MKAASTSYEADAGPVSAVTSARRRPCGTTHIAAHGARPLKVKRSDAACGYNDMSAASMSYDVVLAVPE
jgi:hypothetical protein